MAAADRVQQEPAKALDTLFVGERPLFQVSGRFACGMAAAASYVTLVPRFAGPLVPSVAASPPLPFAREMGVKVVMRRRRGRSPLELPSYWPRWDAAITTTSSVCRCHRPRKSSRSRFVVCVLHFDLFRSFCGDDKSLNAG